MRRGYVYFITDETAIKIGYSVSVEHRMADLRQHAPLRLIASFVGDRLDEGAVLRRFDHLNIRGEWFRPDQEITDFIAKLEQYRRDIEVGIITISHVVNGKADDKLSAFNRGRGIGNIADNKQIKATACEYSEWINRHVRMMTPSTLYAARRVQFGLDAARFPGGRCRAMLIGLAEDIAVLEAALARDVS